MVIIRLVSNVLGGCSALPLWSSYLSDSPPSHPSPRVITISWNSLWLKFSEAENQAGVIGDRNLSHYLGELSLTHSASGKGLVPQVGLWPRRRWRLWHLPCAYEWCSLTCFTRASGFSMRLSLLEDPQVRAKTTGFPCFLFLCPHCSLFLCPKHHLCMTVRRDHPLKRQNSLTFLSSLIIPVFCGPYHTAWW